MSLTVERIKRIDFTQLQLSLQKKIKNSCRPTPNLRIQRLAANNNKMCVMSFDRSWYDKVDWLCGCEDTNSLFCFPCLLLGGETTWSENGFTNLPKLQEKCDKHEHSKRHMENVVSLSLLGRTRASEQASIAENLLLVRYNENIRTNREALSKIIDCIKLCGKWNIVGPDKNIILMENLIRFTADLDRSLKDWLRNNPAINDALKTLQKELLDCTLQVCREHIKSEINETSFVALMIDDVSDVSEHGNVMLLRYELNGKLYERFWTFFSLNNQPLIGSFSPFEEMKRVLENNVSKMIAFSYDRMNYEDFNSRIKDEYPNASFIHCYTHPLNFIIKRALCSIKHMKVFFVNLTGLSDFFFKSKQRLTVLNKYMDMQKSKPLKVLCTFETLSKLIYTVYENKDQLIKCLEELQFEDSLEETAWISTNFLGMLKDEDFLFWLGFFNEIMPHIDILYNDMQCRNIDNHKMKTALEIFEINILQIRDSKIGEIDLNVKITLLQDICNIICSEAKKRFLYSHHLMISKLFYKENFKEFKKNLPADDLSIVLEMYPILDKEKFTTELKVFYAKKELHNFNGLIDLLNLIYKYKLSIFSELTKLLKILITIPMITTDSKRCINSVEDIKNYLKKSLYQDRSIVFPMIHIENNMLYEIPNFNEKVTNIFCQIKNRKKEFAFKR